MRERGESGEGRRLAGARQPGCLLVEDEQHPPGRWKGEAGENGRQRGATGTAVEHDAPLGEGADADARALAALGQSGDGSEVERAPFKRGDGGADGKRELRAGAETGMGRDCLLDAERIGTAHAPRLGEAAQIGKRALPLRPLHRERIAPPERKRRSRPVEREPEAAEGPRPPAARVEETEMEPRAGRDARLLATGGGAVSA